MTEAKLLHFSWFKHNDYSPQNPAKYEANADYNVDGLGKVNIVTTIPKPLAEQLDAHFQAALWERIQNVKGSQS